MRHLSRTATGARFIDAHGNPEILRSNPFTAGKGPPWALILGVAAVGAGVFLMVRRSQAATPATPALTTPTGPIPAKTSLPSPSQTHYPQLAPTVAGTGVVPLLTSSQSARQIFNVQAVAYEFGLTDVPPDGKFGRITQGIINAAQTATGTPTTVGFSPSVLGTVRVAGQNRTTAPRNLPMALPASVIQLLTIDAVTADPSAVPIQATVV